MPLTSGTRLGPYEIVAPLGAGGMGEVYRARDSRLGRDVAVKVLPQHLSASAEVRARFEREARTVSSLNHPHICTLHDVGREGETDFLVMELVDGETLAQRLEKGALPTADVLRLGGQIADALDRAHRAGVIHRDLKPGNVMLTRSGAKLMDFGLARATGLAASPASGPSGAAMTQSPTIAAPLTAEGTIVGTFQYMAPEQLEGRDADARSDVWALGCVLYEMATGKRPFEGRSQASLITAIMGSEPVPIPQLSPMAPAGLDALVRACLAKDPADRLQSAHDIRLQLSWIVTGGTSTAGPVPGAVAPRRDWPLIAAFGVVALVAGSFLGARGLPWRPGARSAANGMPAAGVIEMVSLTDIPGRQFSPHLSADGKMLLYVSRDGTDEDIFLQRVGGENPVNLTANHEGADFDPAFSPDGERIAFGSAREGGGIFLMGATGESPRKLTPDGAHPAWSPDGRKIVYSTERVPDPYSRATNASLWVVDVATGERKCVYDGDAVQPTWSPSGKRIAFGSADGGQRDIHSIPADGGAARPITKDRQADWGPFWAPDGRVMYFLSDRGGSPDLWRIGIDEGSGEVRGEPEAVTTGIARVMAGTTSADGKRIAVTIDEARGEILRLGFDPAAGRPKGAVVPLHRSSKPMLQLGFSPDGDWLTYRTAPPRENIFVMRSDGTLHRRLTDDAFRNRGPQWIRGTDWLLFYSNRTGSYALWLMRGDGTELRMITDRPGLDLNSPVVSPDGARVVMSVLGRAGLPKLGVARVEESWFTPGKPPSPTAIDSIVAAFVPACWSPDGNTIVGLGVTAQGNVPATYSFVTHRLEHCEELRGTTSFGPTWLPDSRRFLYWDVSRDAAVLWDIVAKRGTEVAGVPGPGELKLSADGRTLIVNRTVAEGDVWLLTLK